tara:strand:- start:3176 stop:4576 length:1401 start_codon:yes stop_codon:yes gene_type:complete
MESTNNKIDFNNENIFDIVIIGAGVAGMTAAQELIKKGKNVIIVEARNRIGGRVNPINFKGDHIDLGAQFIHGKSKLNPIMKLINCKKENYTLHHVDWDDGYYYSGNGRSGQIPDGKLDKHYRLSQKALSIAHSKRKSIYKTKTREADCSLGEELRSAIELLKKKTKNIDIDLLNMCTKTEILDDYAVDIDKLSLCYWDQDDEFNGGDCVISKVGYQPILNMLSDGLNISLNQIVTNIKQIEKEHIIVSCQNGSEFIGKKVISTLPLGVLKANTINFEPKLPKRLTESINKLGFGNLEKVVIKFNQQFWPNDSDCFYNMSGNPFRLWLNVSHLYNTNNSKTLICFLAGSVAKKLVTDSNDNDIAILALESLREIFGETIVSSENTIAIKLIDSIIVTRWCTDPFSLGSYSHIPRGTLPSDYDSFGRQYWNDMLHFAGEGTFKRFPGTVHGAILSGERAANHCIGKS